MASRATRFHEQGKSSGLKRNPRTGEIVSIKKSAEAKKKSNPLALWRKAVDAAKKKLGMDKKGEFVPIKKGTPLYREAKKIYEK